MKVFLEILRELDYPHIFLVPVEQMEHIETKMLGVYGMASDKYPVISVLPNLRGKVRTNTIYHEIFHILFPHRPHWWIECAAERMARGGGRGYWSKKYNHTIDDVPSRDRILKLARQASRKINTKV